VAKGHGGLDVLVNALLPSTLDTPSNRADVPGALADFILFLASNAARSISGALILVSRGG